MNPALREATNQVNPAPASESTDAKLQVPMDTVFSHRGLPSFVEAAAGILSSHPNGGANVNDPSCDPCSSACRRFARVAVQQRMGLLSERRIGFGGSDPASACFERKALEELRACV